MVIFGISTFSMSINYKVAGLWKEVQQVSVNVAGIWKNCGDVYVKVGGIWKSVLYAPGSASYTSAGSFSFTVPAGVYSLTSTTIVGGGGGGGGTYGNGDSHAGGSGGSGGKYTGLSIAVTPGEVLTINVGTFGLGGIFNFNSTNWFETPNSGGYAGSAGSASSIYRGATVLYTAGGGGGGGNSGPGDNWNPYSGGAAGSPSGTAGVAGPSERNNYGPAVGATNGTGYGSGGNSNSTQGAGAYGGGHKGTAGAILFSW
jgi:hypothetical protein